MEQYRGNDHFLSETTSMVGGALVRTSGFRVGLGVSGTTIVSGSCTHPSHLWISHLLTSSLSLGISDFFFWLLSIDQFSCGIHVWDRLCTHFEVVKVMTLPSFQHF